MAYFDDHFSREVKRRLSYDGEISVIVTLDARTLAYAERGEPYAQAYVVNSYFDKLMKRRPNDWDWEKLHFEFM